MKNHKNKILIDVGHPADMLLFKEFTKIAITNGYSILFTIRDKDVTKNLLETENLNYISFGKNYKNILGKIFGLIVFNLRLLWVSIKYKPTIFLSAGSIYAAHVSFLLRKPHIVFEDTGNMEQIRLYRPFTSAILTSTSFTKKLSRKQLYYDSYHELAYLHSKRFKPDKSVKQKLNLKDTDKYIILRFVSWTASHDVGEFGLSYNDKVLLVEELSKFAKIYISSESELPVNLEKYKFPLHPNEMHNALAFADLFVGEGATMASESAVLGTPAIYINSIQIDYCTELEEKYELLYNFRKSSGVLDKALDILNNYNKQHWENRQTKFITDKIDLTDFQFWFIDNWPESFKIMKENPDYQNKFK